jgi:hypothetical protein
MNALKNMKDGHPSLWRTVYYGMSRADGRLLHRGYTCQASRADEAERLGRAQAARDMISPRLVSASPESEDEEA